MSRRIYRFQLTPRINDDNELILTASDGEDSFRVTRIDQLLGNEHDDADAITLRVSDFYDKGCVYEAYGLVLDDDGRSIIAYWSSVAQGTGVEHTFDVPDPAQGRLPAFVIGARPRRPGVREPRPASAGGPFPGGLDEGGSGGK